MFFKVGLREGLKVGTFISPQFRKATPTKKWLTRLDIFAKAPENGAQSGEPDRWEGRAVPGIPEVQ